MLTNLSNLPSKLLRLIGHDPILFAVTYNGHNPNGGIIIKLISHFGAVLFYLLLVSILKSSDLLLFNSFMFKFIIYGIGITLVVSLIVIIRNIYLSGIIYIGTSIGFIKYFHGKIIVIPWTDFNGLMNIKDNFKGGTLELELKAEENQGLIFGEEIKRADVVKLSNIPFVHHIAAVCMERIVK
ncbi:MAG: hypothetical protein HOP11_03765 [Saprospiraceae bacterium]|nr:hypothetical protein [Saprospiraceae bacterium]